MSLKISAKTEYACIAVMELAAHQDSSEPVRIRNIAERHSVPPRFLVQILLQLKSANIVESTRGASGGYRLKRKPEEVTLGEVMNIVDGPISGGKRTLAQSGGESPAALALNQVWDEAEKRRQEHLNQVTFADLIRHSNQLGHQGANSFKIIPENSEVDNAGVGNMGGGNNGALPEIGLPHQSHGTSFAYGSGSHSEPDSVAT